GLMRERGLPTPDTDQSGTLPLFSLQCQSCFVLPKHALGGRGSIRTMGLIVQKFGGSSVATAEKIHKAAAKAIAAKNAGNRVALGGLAMGDTHGDLNGLAKPGRGHKAPPKPENDQLMAPREAGNIALISLGNHAQGH